MIRLRKTSLFNEIRKNRTALYYWSLGGGLITTIAALTGGYFIVTFRHKQRTREALRQGDPDRLISPQGLDSKELEKAVVLFEEQKLHDRIQTDNYERYKRLRDKRREQAGLS